jgi:hypothetical protein
LAPVSQARLLFAFGVMLGVAFGSFRSVVLGMLGMAERCYCVMGSFFSRPSFVVFGRFTMVLRGRFVMLGCALVVLCNFGGSSSHSVFPSLIC